jgi:formylmethanofuran dehydrogenase subunit A
MFAKPDFVFKDGQLVVKDGKVVKVTWGATHTTKPAFDNGVEKDLKNYFDKYHTMQLDNFKISNDEICNDGRGSIIVHEGKQASL